MNKKLFLMVLLMGLVIPRLYSQNCTNPPNCILNPGMDGYPQTSALGDPIGTGLPDWWVVSGTPSYDTGMVGSRGVQLDAGEGFATCLSFVNGESYNICIYGYNTTSVAGDLTLQAHDGTNWQTIGTVGYIQNGIGGGPSLRTVNFTANANYTQLRLIASTNANYSIVIDDVGVVENPDISASLTTINECQNTIISLASTNALNVTWTSSTGGALPSGSSITVSPCQTTTYTATYSSTCNPIFGCGNFTKQITINVIPKVTSVTANPPSIDICQSSTLTANAVPGTTVNWTSSTGGALPSGNSITVSPCQTTTYTATVSCGTTCPPDVISYTLQVNDPISIINNNPTVQCGDQIILRASGTPSCPATYQWQDPQGNVVSTAATLNIPVANSSHTGIYTLITTYPNGCQSQPLTTIVNVVNCCVAEAEFMEGPDCNPVQFTDMSTGTSTPISWFWEFGDGAVSTKQNPKHLYLNQYGPMDVCLTVMYKEGSETCCDKFCKEIQVCDFHCGTVADFKHSRVTPYVIQFTDMSVGVQTACQFHWDFGDGNTSTLQNPTHTYTNPGTYTVCYTVTYCIYTVGGAVTAYCTDTYCEEVTY